jgi:hypothetical protein
VKHVAGTEAFRNTYNILIGGWANVNCFNMEPEFAHYDTSLEKVKPLLNTALQVLMAATTKSTKKLRTD